MMLKKPPQRQKPLSLQEKRDRAQADLDRFTKAASLPNLTPEERELAYNQARSAKASLTLGNMALAWAAQQPDPKQGCGGQVSQSTKSRVGAGSLCRMIPLPVMMRCTASSREGSPPSGRRSAWMRSTHLFILRCNKSCGGTLVGVVELEWSGKDAT